VRSDLLLRCRRSTRDRQNDQTLVVRPPLYETGLFGVADRLLEVRAIKTDVAADARYECGLLVLRR
jgi:hypothetical protein